MVTGVTGSASPSGLSAPSDLLPSGFRLRCAFSSCLEDFFRDNGDSDASESDVDDAALRRSLRSCAARERDDVGVERSDTSAGGRILGIGGGGFSGGDGKCDEAADFSEYRCPS